MYNYIYCTHMYIYMIIYVYNYVYMWIIMNYMPVVHRCSWYFLVPSRSVALFGHVCWGMKNFFGENRHWSYLTIGSKENMRETIIFNAFSSQKEASWPSTSRNHHCYPICPGNTSLSSSHPISSWDPDITLPPAAAKRSCAQQNGQTFAGMRGYIHIS
jgi:hypothetical protein